MGRDSGLRSVFAMECHWLTWDFYINLIYLFIPLLTSHVSHLEHCVYLLTIKEHNYMYSLYIEVYLVAYF